MQKILVIDDDEVFRDATLIALERRGFSGLQAEGGQSGLDVARRELPDLIICDVHMNDMDGYCTLDRLRKEPATATIPLILMTGDPNDAGRRQGMNLGADDYLHKPFTAPELFSAVNARLQKKQTLQQDAEKKLAELRSNITLALPHEMVTPLNGIFACADLLTIQAGAMLPAEIADLGRNILESAQRLHHTIENFLLYAQLEVLATDPQGVASLRQKETANTRELIEERARKLAARSNRSADLHLELTVVAVAMSAELFCRLVDELLENAFQFSRPGTPVHARSSTTGPQFMLSVGDQGEGMDPAQVARIGAYSQFDRQTREQQGTGLGLAIVKKLVDLHGGHLVIQSRRGAGATFKVTLPTQVPPSMARS
jgi:signal transduction histidine kinase